eukprot:jgi/Mesen1/10874/ME000093S10386
MQASCAGTLTTASNRCKRELERLVASDLQKARGKTMAGEEKAAAAAAESRYSEGGTIFDKIVRREIPATIIFEDDKVLAFRDIHPQAPTHVIVIPKERDGLSELAKAEERHKGILGHLVYAAQLVAKQEGLDDFRLVVNNGPGAGQSVFHLHLHVLGGRPLRWPPG